MPHSRIRFFIKGKHGLLGPSADKDFGVLADGDIGPVVGRADIVSNRLAPFSTISFSAAMAVPAIPVARTAAAKTILSPFNVPP